MTNVKDLYKAHYEECQDRHERLYSKYTWAIEQIFDIWTYDTELDEIFMKAIIEVCKVIRDQTNFDYIKDQSSYIKYIQVCQFLDRFHWIEWGTSIRGAWFEECYHMTIHSKEILSELKWCGPEQDETGRFMRHVIDEVPFTVDNIRALIEFMEE